MWLSDTEILFYQTKIPLLYKNVNHYKSILQSKPDTFPVHYGSLIAIFLHYSSAKQQKHELQCVLLPILLIIFAEDNQSNK